MTYRQATYEEYLKASTYAKLRYKFGVYIQIIGVLLFIYTMFYVITNIEEMKANPREYAEEKLGVICVTPLLQNTHKEDYGSNRSFENIGKG